MKKILTLTTIILILLNNFNFCFAIEEQTKTIKHITDCKLYMKYKGDYKQVHYAAFEENGKEFPAYCLTPQYNGVGTHGRDKYNVKITDKVTNENVWKVLMNGFPNKSLEELGVENREEAYVATQFAVYTALENRNINDYSPDSSESGKRTYNAYLKIMENANKEIFKNPSLEILKISENWEYKNNYLIKQYSINSNEVSGKYSVKLQGENIENFEVVDLNGEAKTNFDVKENFFIKVPLNIMTKDIEFEINVEAVLNTKPILYGKTTIEETQDYALTGYQTENFTVSLKDKTPKNNTKIIIVKQDSKNGKLLKGVQFNLLNSGKDQVIQNLETDIKGEIQLNYLEPGIYYLQEIKTLDDYILNEELIEINLEYNEEYKKIITNSQKEEIEETENIKKLPVTGY